MKFLIFIGIATAVYFLLIRPIFIGSAKAQAQAGGLGDMMEAFNKMREQMQNGGAQASDFTTNDGRMKVNNPKGKNKSSNNDDGEFIDYEEIK